jgi:hypothetical protein
MSYHAHNTRLAPCLICLLYYVQESPLRMCVILYLAVLTWEQNKCAVISYDSRDTIGACLRRAMLSYE